MTAYASNQAGDWATPTVWTPNGTPGNGDTVSCGHAITVSDSRIVGTSPASDTTVVLTIASAGSLTIQNGGTLKVRGAVSIQNTALTINGGGHLQMDSTQAASPTTRHYRIRIGSANNQASAYLVCDASSNATPGVFDSDVTGGAGAGYTDGGGAFTRGGKVKFSYCNISNIGDATRFAFDPDLNSNSSDSTFFDHCIIDTCGGMAKTAGNQVDGITFRAFHSTFKNCTGLTPWRFSSNDTFTSGERSIKFCVFDADLEMQPARNFTIDDNLFYHWGDYFSAAPLASFQRNFVRKTGSVVFTALVNLTDNYWLQYGGTVNPHYIGPDDSVGNLTFDGNIFESDLNPTTGDPGDTIVMPTAGAAVVYTITRSIVLPNDDGGSLGTVASALGNANVTFSVEHCTYFNSGPGSGLTVGEGAGTAHAGMLSSLKSNIAWGPSGTPVALKVHDDIDVVTDIVSATNADYNCGWRVATGSKGKGYDTPMTGTPGAHDVDQDPSFVDSTRNINTWDASLGGAGTRANALAELMKINDRTGYNSNYSIPNLIAYVRAGFVVQNTNLRTAAHDGTVIGAVQDAPSGGGALVTGRSLLGSPIPMRRGPGGLRRGKVFRFSSDNPVPLVSTITASSSLTLPLSPAATVTVLVQGASSLTLPLSPAATGTVLVQGASSVTLGLSPSATATVDVQATSAVQVGLSGSASATNLVQAASSVTIAMTGSATLTVNPSPPPPYQMAIPMRPTAGGFVAGRPFAFSSDNPVPLSATSTATSSLTVPIVCSATGTVQIQGASALTIGLSPAATATVLAQAASTVTLPLTATATATNLVQAVSAQLIAIAAAAAAQVAVQAASALTIALSGSAQGGTGVFATSSRTIAMTCSATGTVTDPSTQHPPVYGQSRFLPADYQSRFYPKDFQ